MFQVPLNGCMGILGQNGGGECELREGVPAVYRIQLDIRAEYPTVKLTQTIKKFKKT